MDSKKISINLKLLWANLKKVNYFDWLLYIITTVSLLFSIIIITIFLKSLSKFYTFGINIQPDMSITGQVGDFIGGVMNKHLIKFSMMQN